MKRLFSFLFASTLCLLSWSQASKLDSLQKIAAQDRLDSSGVEAVLSLMSYYINRDPKRSIKYAERAIQVGDSLGHMNAIAEGLNQIGTIYYRMRFLSRAMEQMIQAAEVNRQSKEYVKLGFNYMMLGMISQDRGMSSESKEYFEKAEDLLSEHGRTRDVFVNRHNQASAFSDDEPEFSERIYRENLALARKDKLGGRFLSATLNNLGNTLKEKGEYKAAEPYYLEALEIKLRDENLFQAATTYANLGNLMIQLDRLDEAEAYLHQAKFMADSTNNYPATMEYLSYFSDLAEKRGQYKEALRFHREFKSIADSIETANREEEVENLLVFFKVEEDRNKIELLEAENEVVQARSRQRETYLLIAMCVGAVLLLLVGGLGYFVFQNRRKNAMLAEKNAFIERQVNQLNDSNKRLAELNHEKDGLLNIVAHDLKAPLSKTLGLVELVGLSGQLNSEQQEVVEMLKRVNADAGKLVADLLSLNALEAGKDEGEKSNFDLGGTLEEVVREFSRAAAQKEITLKVQVSEKAILVHARRDHFVRVMDNLMSNALKFSPKGSFVEVGVSDENGEAVCWVKDKGPGISSEDQAKMFRKFQRLSARPTGGEGSSGLGLSIVKTVVEHMGGRIVVDSTLGEGSTFEVRLPETMRVRHPNELPA